MVISDLQATFKETKSGGQVISFLWLNTPFKFHLKGDRWCKKRFLMCWQLRVFGRKTKVAKNAKEGNDLWCINTQTAKYGHIVLL